jgi:hypothetical protein
MKQFSFNSKPGNTVARLLSDFFAPDGVELGVTDRDEETEACGGERLGDPIEGNDRAAMQFRLLEVGLVDGKARNIEFGIMGEIKVGELCDITGAEYNDLLFQFISSLISGTLTATRLRANQLRESPHIIEQKRSGSGVAS